MQDLGNELLGRRHGGDGELRPDEFWAVKDVSFELKRGECLGLIGRNGAGKTTLLRMLNGLIKPDAGRIEMRGRVGALIALGAGFNPILTGRENIYVNAAVLGLSKQEIDAKFEEIVEFAELGEFIDAPVQNYSSGMTVRLGFAVSTTLDPDVLILDEVLAVGDAAFRVKCFNRMASLISQTAVIFVSHNMPQVTRICSGLILMDKGKPLQQGAEFGAIIARYNSLHDQLYQPITQGSGEARIHSVVIEDENQIPVNKLIYGSSFSILINLSLSKKILTENNIRILITISNEEDNNVAQIIEPIKQIKTEDLYALRMFFSEALFNMGRYSLTVNILTGSVGKLVSVMRQAVTFKVQHSLSAYAPIIIRPRDIKIINL